MNDAEFPDPQVGEIVLACAHEFIEQRGFMYALDLRDGVPHELEYIRSDGSIGKAKWARICLSCHQSQTPFAMIAAEFEWGPGLTFVKAQTPTGRFREN